MSAVAASVIIPVFNAAKTLGAQLEALAAQVDAPSFEVLVCDNGSTDDTTAVASLFVGRVPGLRVVAADARRGPSAARNEGARQANGRLLLFCDGDDVVGDRWVGALATALGDAALAGGVFEHALLNGEGGTVTWDVGDRVRMGYWPQYVGIPAGNLGVRASVFHELGGFAEFLTIGEDTDFSWRAQLAGNSVADADDAVVHLRKRRGLRGIYRQARSYGVGGRVLEARYALIAAEYWRHQEEQNPIPAPAEGDGGAQSRARHVLSRAARVRRAGDLADVAWRLGEWRGRRAPAPAVEALPARS